MTTPTIGGSGEPADPYMPQHGHGASTVPTVTAQGGGAFSVAAIDFFMGGYWELYLDSDAARRHRRSADLQDLHPRRLGLASQGVAGTGQRAWLVVGVVLLL